MVSRTALLLAAAALVLVGNACGDDDNATSTTGPLLPTAPTTAEPTATTSSPPTSTIRPPDPTTTTELNPPPIIADPPTTPTTVLELPPVTTLVPEVRPELLQPEVLDPTNPNYSRPIRPEHIPVLESHLAAIQANTLVSSQWPIDPEAPVLIGAPLTPETLARIQQSLRDRLAAHEVLEVSQGVTFRPYVVGPVTDTAVVYDCELAGHYWTNADTGALVAPTEVWPAGPGHVVEVGLRVDMVQRDGRWLVNASQIDPGACA